MVIIHSGSLNLVVSDFYATTSLHGLHVTLGTLGFSKVGSSLRKDKGYKEVHLILKF